MIMKRRRWIFCLGLGKQTLHHIAAFDISHAARMALHVSTAVMYASSLPPPPPADNPTGITNHAFSDLHIALSMHSG